MSGNAFSYRSGSTVLHSTHACVKIVGLAVFSATLFFLDTPWGIGLAALAICAALATAKIPVVSLLHQMIPVFVLAAFTLIFAAIPASMSAWQYGCLAATRMVLVVMASAVLTATTSTEEVAAGVRVLVSPLGAIGVPVDRFSVIVSTALRFIPVTVAEYYQVKDAQSCRGARFDAGGPITRIGAYAHIMIPLFVGLYRRAAVLGEAMDARCLGAHKKSHLNEVAISPCSGVILVVLCAICVIAACNL